ncbi:MAG: hypothetical protein NXH96_08800 [Alteromonadaceae bacterium]|nr:hypothetical protein [Alteromonadaceae bacterium]
MKLLWVSDADNTLWDTNKVFAESQLMLLEFSENLAKVKIEDSDRLQYLRELDQNIASMHHLGLRYPVELLIDALLMRLNGTPALKSARNSISNGLNKADSLVRKAAEDFRQNVSQTPPLRDGVLLGLERLRRDDAMIIVATEGGLKRIRKHLFDHGLSEFIHLSIETTKTPGFFSRCRKLHQERIPWCIGDQITRDINPAVEAGFHGLYFPGGFSPNWESNRPHFQNFVTIDNYCDGVNHALSSK